MFEERLLKAEYIAIPKFNLFPSKKAIVTKIMLMRVCLT